MHIFELQELERATNNFSPSHLVGRGSHGSVYRGLLSNGTVAAIKTQSPALTRLRHHSNIQKEAHILSSLPPHNPCLVDFLGTSHDAYANAIIVTRYMPNGTLHDLLHTCPAPPSYEKRIEIALRVARGVCSLHQAAPAAVAHRDIKPANILFDEAWGARLSDFGLAAEIDGDARTQLPPPAGTIGYMDPAYTSHSSLNLKVDVFSYGVVLMELISGRKAIDLRKSPASIVEWAVPLIRRGRVREVCDRRVRVPAHMERAVWKTLRLAALCVTVRVGDRPEMCEVVGKLDGLMVGLGQPPLRQPNSLHAIFVRMVRLKKCGVDNGRDQKSGNAVNGIKKGASLVRGILTDITVK